jgi:hypothetical protein
MTRIVASAVYKTSRMTIFVELKVFSMLNKDAAWSIRGGVNLALNLKKYVREKQWSQ